VYAAANYFILGRTLYYIPWLSPIHPGRVVITFIALDGMIETLVANGASKMSNTRLSVHVRLTGEDLVKAALILQACTFAVFIGILATWHFRVQKAGLLKQRKELQYVCSQLYISSALITARCVYRIIKFFQGYTGPVYTHETYFYIFDASLMLLNSWLLEFLHPGRFFPQDASPCLAKDGVTEVKGPGMEGSEEMVCAVG
jgi:hypothetical protein